MKEINDNLFDVIHRGDLNRLKSIVEENNLEIDTFLKNGQTIMTFAASRGQTYIVNYALEKGASLSLRDAKDETPFLSALSNLQEPVLKIIFSKFSSNKDCFLYLKESDDDLKNLIMLSLKYILRKKYGSEVINFGPSYKILEKHKLSIYLCINLRKEIDIFFGLELLGFKIKENTTIEQIMKKIYGKYNPNFFQRLFN